MDREKMLRMVAVLGDMARTGISCADVLGPVTLRVSAHEIPGVGATAADLDDLQEYMADYGEFDYTAAFPGDSECPHVMCSSSCLHESGYIALMTGFDGAALYHLANAAKGGE